MLRKMVLVEAKIFRERVWTHSMGLWACSPPTPHPCYRKPKMTWRWPSNGARLDLCFSAESGTEMSIDFSASLFGFRPEWELQFPFRLPLSQSPPADFPDRVETAFKEKTLD
jgi:hypothetical protein